MVLTNAAAQKEDLLPGLGPKDTELLAVSRRLMDVAFWTPGPRSLLLSRSLPSQAPRCVWHEEAMGESFLAIEGCDGASIRLTPKEESVRGMVGYGGGALAALGEQLFYVCRKAGAVLGFQSEGMPGKLATPRLGNVVAPTPDPSGKYLVFIYSDAQGQDVLACVPADPSPELCKQWQSAETPAKGCSIDTWPKALGVEVLHRGEDFYMQPAWSDDGGWLAWVSWRHPHMPWEKSQLWLQRMDGFSAAPTPCDTGSETVFQPIFVGADRFVVAGVCGDRWGLSSWVWNAVDGCWCAAAPPWMAPEGAEVGEAAWLQGQRVVARLGSELAVVANCGARKILLRAKWPEGGTLAFDDAASIAQPKARYFAQPALAPKADGKGGQLALLASDASMPPAVWLADWPLLAPPAKTKKLTPWRALGNNSCWPISVSEISWQGMDLPQVGCDVHGILFEPTLEPTLESALESQNAEKNLRLPPLLVWVHGGPTTHVHMGWESKAHFFTSKGYAVLWVNYRGSTGYGEAYRQALNGQWGVVDVDDAITGARALVAGQKVDGRRMAILGSSAGGYSVLRALQDPRDVFAAGVCAYGISDLLLLAQSTHKFEAHYLEPLLGRLPEAEAVYRSRSPIHAPEKLRRPLAIFQGADDKVVPVDQSEAMIEVLKHMKIPHHYRLFPGEGHGFRKPAHVACYLRETADFLAMHGV